MIFRQNKNLNHLNENTKLRFINIILKNKIILLKNYCILNQKLDSFGKSGACSSSVILLNA